MPRDSRQPGHRTIPLAGLVVCWALLAPAIGVADVVSAPGRPIAVDVKITGLRDGQLFYRPAGGQELGRPVEQIRYLQIAGWERFNQAEKEQRDAKATMAIASYEASLKETENAPPGGPDRRLLVQCRLVRLYDLQGRFEEAVTTYLEAVDKMPTVVETLRPARLSRTDPHMLRKAAEQVEKAIARRDRLDPVALSLEKWRAGWPDEGMGLPRAPGTTAPAGSVPLLPRSATRPAEADPATAAAVAEVRSLMEKGAFDRALERIAMTQATLGTLPPDLYYWQGRAYLAGAGRASKEEGIVRQRRAGLAFMRVVIHSPESPFAAECLYRAGEIAGDEGRPDRAAALWAELLASYPNAAPWVQQARQASEQRRVTASGPAK